MSDEAPKSFVLIEFEGPGVAAFNLKFENVTPAQVLGATAILEVKAKNEFIRMENARLEYEANQKLSVPDSKILIGK